MKNALILFLAALLVWFGLSLARVENQRYALWLGTCPQHDSAQPETLANREECLAEAQTRTNPLYNVAYGLGIL